MKADVSCKVGHFVVFLCGKLVAGEASHGEEGASYTSQGPPCLLGLIAIVNFYKQPQQYTLFEKERCWAGNVLDGGPRSLRGREEESKIMQKESHIYKNT